MADHEWRAGLSEKTQTMASRGLIQTTRLQLRNFRDYCQEIGLRGALTLLQQRAAKVEVFELPVRGLRKPVFCRSQGSDFAVLRMVLGNQDAAIGFDKPPEFIIDAGANVGYSSLVFAKHYPMATIVGVEPDRANCEMFRKNCAGYSNIQLLEGAVWPHSTTVTIANPEADSLSFQVREGAPGAETNLVRAYTISEIIDANGADRVDLLKLDIEGAEVALFTEGVDKWLARVDVILVELHDRFVPGCRAALDQLLTQVEHTREQRGEYVCARLRHS
jgi:FkbM family methyltransferase